jgi:hypothetical protein
VINSPSVDSRLVQLQRILSNAYMVEWSVDGMTLDAGFPFVLPTVLNNGS